MTTQHTPGPWEIDGEYVQQAGQTEVGICSVLNMDVGGDKDWYHGPITQANARLIAAAPTMYAYLEQRAAEGDEDARTILGGIHANA